MGARARGGVGMEIVDNLAKYAAQLNTPYGQNESLCIAPSQLWYPLHPIPRTGSPHFSLLSKAIPVHQHEVVVKQWLKELYLPIRFHKVCWRWLNGHLSII